MHTQNRPISKIFLLPLHLFEPGSEKMGVFLKRKLKVLSLVWNGKGFLGGVFANIFEKIFSIFFGSNDSLLQSNPTGWKKVCKTKKSPPDLSNREEKVFVKLLDCKLYNINFPKLKIYWFWKIGGQNVGSTINVLIVTTRTYKGSSINIL